MNELDLEIADRHDIVRLDTVEQHVVEHIKFAKPLFGQREREPRRIDRQIELAQDVGKRADVVLVAVGQDDGGEVVAVFL